MKYIPALDGLRAIAILGVLVFHTVPEVLKGGFVGVDVFFVLSGYLITSVILHDLRLGHFSLRSFYLRRIQRLLPNAICMILVTVVLAHYLLLSLTTAQVAQHGLWALFNLSNVYIWISVGGYWGESASSLPLLHTWSLAVEEQFYLFFPLILWLVARYYRSALFAVTCILLLSSFAYSVYGTWRFPAATFYLLPTRAWEPLLGAMLAIYQVPVRGDQPLRSLASKSVAEFAGWVGLSMILSGFFLVTEGSKFPGWVALLPTVGAAAMIISFADGTTRAGRVFSTPFMVMIGKLSYSLYLWHWPLIVIARRRAELTGGSTQTAVLIGACSGVLVSVVAYWIVEQPFRLRGVGINWRPRLFVTSLSCAAVTILLLMLVRPVAERDGAFDSPVYHAKCYNVLDCEHPNTTAWAARYSDVQFTLPDPHPAEIWKTGGIVHDWGHTTPRIVVLGSSHATMYGRLIDDICKELKISVAFLSAEGVSAFFAAKVDKYLTSQKMAQQYDDARRKWIRKWQPDAILVIDRWDGWGKEGFSQRLNALVQELEPHTQHLVLFSQVPVLPIGEDVNVRELVTLRLRINGGLPKIPPDRNEAFRKSVIQEFETLAQTHSKIQLVRADLPFYLQDGSIKYSSGRIFYYIDDDHLSQSGTELLRETCHRAIGTACGL